MIVEPADQADLTEIIAMRQEASQWLRERGVDQWGKPWPDYEGMPRRISASIAAGETWMVRDSDGTTTATVALDTFADPRLRTPEERGEPALYLHRLVASRAAVLRDLIMRVGLGGDTSERGLGGGGATRTSADGG